MTVKLGPANQLHRQERSAGRVSWNRWVELNWEETANSDLEVFAGDVVTGVTTEVKTAFDSVTSDDCIVGDGDDPNGYVVDEDLQVPTSAAVGMAAGAGSLIPGKRYLVDDKIDIVISSVGGSLAAGLVRVHVHGFHDPD